MARKRFQRGSVYLCGKTPMWYGRYREDVVGENGEKRRVRRNVPLGSKKEYPTQRLAERALDRLLFRINDPSYRPSRVASVAEFAERWKDQVLSQRKPSTKKAAESHLGAYIIPRLGKLRLDDLGVENQQMFVGYLSEKVSRKTVVNIVGTLSSMLNTAKNWGYTCDSVSVSRLVFPGREVRHQARSFTAEEARAILDLAQDPWRTMFAIAAYAGLRAGEILGLSVEDVDLVRGILNIRKTAWYGRIQTAKSVGSENTIPIADNLAEMLRKVIGERKEGLLFVNKAGRPYSSSGKVVQKKLWPLCDALKIRRAGFHAFRHMHTTILLETGATPKVAQRQLRHADSRVTLDHYAHLIDSSHREAVEKAAAFLDRSGPKINGSVN
jgi:integrase